MTGIDQFDHIERAGLDAAPAASNDAQATADGERQRTRELRRDLWDAVAQLESLRVELRRGDVAYGELVAANLRLSAELEAAQSAAAELTATVHELATVRATREDELAAVRTELNSLADAYRSAAEAAAERDALLATRTFRWTNGGRRVWRLVRRATRA